MKLLIDGYNLLHCSGLFGHETHGGAFAAARAELIDFLVSALSPEELSQATIVFDAKDAPPGLPREYSVQGLTVRYAAGYAEADELLEELIRREHAPRGLTVVSGDRRVQRAAKRRKATPHDSKTWYLELRRTAACEDEPLSTLAGAVFSPEELAELKRDGARIEAEESLSTLAVPNPPAQTPETRSATAESHAPTAPKRGIRGRRRHVAAEKELKATEFDNPFPPGYGEDVLEEEGE